MAEFQEVCRQAQRMLSESLIRSDEPIWATSIGPFRVQWADAPWLSDTEPNAARFYMMTNFKDAEHAEKMIMKWAAEHPEPVYPTWKEWLISMGLVKEREIGETVELPDGSFLETNKEMYTLVNWDKPIPADVAQRLGVEPKEG